MAEDEEDVDVRSSFVHEARKRKESVVEEVSARCHISKKSEPVVLTLQPAECRPKMQMFGGFMLPFVCNV